MSEEEKCLCGFTDTVTYWIKTGRSDSPNTTYRGNMCIHCYEHELKLKINESRKERFNLNIGCNVVNDSESIEQNIIKYLSVKGYATNEQIMANVQISSHRLGRKMKALRELGFIRTMRDQSNKRFNVHVLKAMPEVLTQ